MPENPTSNQDLVPTPSQPVKLLVETLLIHKFPMKPFLDAMRQVAQYRQTPEDGTTAAFYVQVEAEREQLLMRPEAELRQMMARIESQRHAAEAARKAEKQIKEADKAAKKEAAKFYNHKDAEADFDYWSKVEAWTFEEAIALLLGKDPKKVKFADVKREITSAAVLFGEPPKPSPFVHQYIQLREIAQRAQAMQGALLNPLKVLIWADRNGAVQAPPQLIQGVAARIKRQIAAQAVRTPAVANTAAPSPPAAIAVETAALKWTPERLEELRKFKAANGTKATAEHYKISDTRVRKLAPTERPASPSFGGFPTLSSRRK